MSKPIIAFTSTLAFAALLLVPVSRASVGDGDPGAASRSLVSDDPDRVLYPHNVECKDFDKTGYKVWQLRDRSTVDLGNWDAAFPITGAIEPGTFVSKGVDLFDVLEIKCGLSALEHQQQRSHSSALFDHPQDPSMRSGF